MAENTPNGTASSHVSREEAQRRVEEILAQGSNDRRGKDTTKRQRTVLIVVLVILLLLLAGIGAFLYRLLVPTAGTPSATGGDDSGTNGIVWIRSIYGYGPAPDQLFINPNDATTAPDGTIWVTDPGNFRIVGFRGDGSFADLIAGDKLTGEPFRLPSRIAVDPDGVMYVVDRQNETLTIMDGHTKLASASIPGLMCVDADDGIVVVGSTSGFAILDMDGNVKTLVGARGKGPDEFDTVSGVAIDPGTKSIYVLDTYNNRLSSWDYSGKRKWISQLGNAGNDVVLQGGASLETSSSAAAALQIPTDVTIDGNGRPMVLDAFDFTISAFNAKNGKFIDKWGTYGEQDGKFMYPSGFDYDRSKDWFTVADTQNLRAQIVRVKGTGKGGASAAQAGFSRFMSGPARALWPCFTLLPLLLLLLLFARIRRRAKETRLERLARQESVSPEQF